MKKILKSLAAVLLAVPLALHAQAWPSKQIRIIVPFTTGGFNDTLGHILSLELPRSLSQPVIVENKPGGGHTASVGGGP